MWFVCKTLSRRVYQERKALFYANEGNFPLGMGNTVSIFVRCVYNTERREGDVYGEVRSYTGG